MKRRLLISLFATATLGGYVLGQSPYGVPVYAEPIPGPIPVAETPVSATYYGSTGVIVNLPNTPATPATILPANAAPPVLFNQQMTSNVYAAPMVMPANTTYPANANDQIVLATYAAPANQPAATPLPMPAMAAQPAKPAPVTPVSMTATCNTCQTPTWDPFSDCCSHCYSCLFDPLPCCNTSHRWYGSLELLDWRMKGDHLPPLLTTSPPGTPQEDAGVLGLDTTTIIFGDTSVNDNNRHGGRFTVGYWFDPCQCDGVEFNFMFLNEESTQFFASSNDFPILARPFFNTDTEQQASLLVSFPGLVAGFAHIDVTSKLYGGEINLRHNVYRCCNCCIDVLGGYRYLHLNERVRINETEIDADPDSPTFQSYISLEDSFVTDSQFYGLNFGVNAEHRCGRLTFGLLAKLGLGLNNNRVTVRGSQTQVAADGSSETFPAGFLALESNSGRRSEDTFAIVPELGLSVAYDITCCSRIHLGYSFLYWTDVVRPGDQIDLTVNPNFVPPATFEGPVRPGPRMNESNFWAHGLNFGVDFRF